MKRTSKPRHRVRVKRRRQPGVSPGDIVPAKGADAPTLNIIAYGRQGITEKVGASLDDVNHLRETHDVIWLDVQAFGNAELIMKIGDAFGLHRLALEDAVNAHHRPKVDDYDDHLFVATRMLKQGQLVETEQVGFFIGQGFLLSFQSEPGDCFDSVRTRLRRAKGRIRQAGSDYLFSALYDAILDAYFPAFEALGETLEDLEGAVVHKPVREHVSRLHHTKRDLLLLRRSIWPQRDVINTLIRDEHHLITDKTRPFLRDCYDHTVQLLDFLETYRDIASGLLDIYISSESTKLNEIMKVLTVIATIFMPLSFIASLYGMNFDRSVSPWNMPELGWVYGYPFALLLMLGSVAALLWYFRQNGWLFDRRSDPTD